MPSWSAQRAATEAQRVAAKQAQLFGRVIGGVDEPGLEPPRALDPTYAIWTKERDYDIGCIPLVAEKSCLALSQLLERILKPTSIRN